MEGLDPDLVAAMRSLPSRQRAAVWLRYGEDMTTSQVAAVMRVSDVAARQLLKRGRDGLRTRLERDQGA